VGTHQLQEGLALAQAISAHEEMSCGLIAIGALELREAVQAWAMEGAAPTYSSLSWKRSAYGYTGSAATSPPESWIPRAGVSIHFGRSLHTFGTVDRH
jgi:hypothetical protein